MSDYDDLDILADFCNTRDERLRYEGDPGLDHLQTCEQLQLWLLEHHLLTEEAVVTDEELQLARELRRGMRIAIDPLADRQVEAAAIINEVASQLAAAVIFDPSMKATIQFAGTKARQAIGKLLLLILNTQQTNAWNRLKMCTAEDCRWVFIDRSRPGSGKWCSMQACGNRAKKRTFRERQKEEKKKVPE
ncbi:CGNR zinc finger domain-containing protein [Brevibacillus ruminantium]|uniref:CGNR zinc finger domain-containing protein n=1 Tax=Brevibacillus ruminantium TaxID=2950604 RepID=A0ABY4WHL5_9BACL|nr:CGNR zinc finger domain-containing protein [Brevibacillus ruminantium]USG66630.1 CGNR zinc finger domain-containing protein [Brevibacillus ruminantium]